MTPRTATPNTVRKNLVIPARTFVALATLLCLSGCPDRPTNRGTDVPVQAGERFEKDAAGKPSGSSDESRTSKDAGRDSTANAEEKPATSTDKR